jgi:hypothetical protein
LGAIWTRASANRLGGCGSNVAAAANAVVDGGRGRGKGASEGR